MFVGHGGVITRRVRARCRARAISATAQIPHRLLPGPGGIVVGMNLTRKRTTRTIASVLVTGAAALGVVGCGGSSGDATTNAAATQGAATTATTPGGTSTTQGGATQGGPGAISTTALAAAAKELGVSTAKLQAAMQAARPSAPSASGGTQPGAGSAGGSGSDPQTEMYAAIAKTLGTTSAKVKAALADVLPAGGRGGAPGGTPPSGAQGGTPPSGTTPPAASGSDQSSSSTAAGTAAS
jgi:hypothetical protein